MLNLLANLFGRNQRSFFGRRPQSGLGALLHGRRQSGYGRRGGMALGTIASIAAPFLIRKLQNRRTQRAGL